MKRETIFSYFGKNRESGFFVALLRLNLLAEALRNLLELRLSSQFQLLLQGGIYLAAFFYVPLLELFSLLRAQIRIGDKRGGLFSCALAKLPIPVS